MTTAAATVEAPARRAPAWINGPALDLVVGCGAWSAPLLALVYLLGARFDASVALVFYALSLACNYPHYMATLYRAYRTRDEFARYRFFTLYVTALLVLTAALTHWAPRMLPIFYTIFVTWSPWHYTGQNFGIAMMFARRNGASPTRADRNWLWVAFAASYLMIFIALHSGTSDEQYVLSLGLPVAAGRVVRFVLLGVFAGAGLRALWRMAAQTSARAMVAPIVLYATQFLWFVLPSILEIGFGWQLPRTSYSIGVLAFMHCAQYLWITSYYARREAESGRVARWRPWAYAATLVIGGIALFIPGPWLVSAVLHYDFAASFLIFSALVNIHHFVVDGVIWKLRDGRVASLLLGSAERREEGQAAWNVARLFGGRALPVRVAMVVAAVALVALAGLDQARFYFSRGRSDLASLQRAERLTPFDATVLANVARAEADAGQMDEAIASLRAAVAINPYDAAAQRALAQMLLAGGRYEEAYAQHAQMVRYITPDVDTLINYGTLAGQLGHTDEAIDCWTQALALDANQPLAHLALAEALASKGAYAEAIPHFERYIALVPQRSALRDPKQIMGVVLELGDSYARTERYEQAAQYYKQMASLATSTGDPSYESTAYSRLASLYDGLDQRQGAIEYYHRTLDLDEKAGDARSSAMDWFNYGQFLRKIRAPNRLVIACFLKARDGLKDTPGPDLDTVEKTLAEAEAASSADAAAARRDPEAAATEARAYGSRQ